MVRERLDDATVYLVRDVDGAIRGHGADVRCEGGGEDGGVALERVRGAVGGDASTIVANCLRRGCGVRLLGAIGLVGGGTVGGGAAGAVAAHARSHISQLGVDATSGALSSSSSAAAAWPPSSGTRATAGARCPMM
eukprot:4648674-Pyramimonas_sp.AAC.2